MFIILDIFWSTISFLDPYTLHCFSLFLLCLHQGYSKLHFLEFLSNSFFLFCFPLQLLLVSVQLLHSCKCKSFYFTLEFFWTLIFVPVIFFWLRLSVSSSSSLKQVAGFSSFQFFCFFEITFLITWGQIRSIFISLSFVTHQISHKTPDELLLSKQIQVHGIKWVEKSF